MITQLVAPAIPPTTYVPEMIIMMAGLSHTRSTAMKREAAAVTVIERFQLIL